MTTHMARAGVLVAALLFAPSSGLAQNDSTNQPLATQAPLDQRAVTQPYWLRRPSSDQIESFYPKAALRKNIQGEAQIRCTVKDDGGLTRCKVVSETPKGHGFGGAAVKGSKYFQMRPKILYGGPIASGVVYLTIPFRCSKQAAKLLCDPSPPDVEGFTSPLRSAH